ncbi:Crp/Fnr family transcriptional regulator [Dysgonomonas sp. ZJ709]|uniref:Crp/Fnr family transcriptional regulator n=1 Tax=Dysgonomonas sp. ZJ709 TaxID=2709797 RepID=UPI0013EC25BE|nr:Crp/Fnr family transcriptional regulator [Dysgonomonas sp. ZJ709]
MQYSQLYNIVSNYIDLEPEDIELIKTYFKYGFAEKGTALIEFGKPTDKAFFILSGYLKYFKIVDSGEELIIHLYTPDNFAISLGSFFLGKKSEEALETITDCEFLYISKADLEKLYTTSYKWHSFGRKLMESALIEKEERVIDQLTLTAQDKYMKLLKKQPDIIQNVPVKYIASFIGIQPESLSRIRKTN